MSNLLKYTKRVWTAVLASALILTSVPYNVYADEPDNTSEPEIVEVVDDVEPAAEGADGDVLLDNAAVSGVTFTLTHCSLAETGHTGITKDGDAWYVDQEGEDGSKTNLKEIKVKLEADENYTLEGTTVSATVGETAGVVTGPESGVYTIKADADATAALDGGVAITAEAVEQKWTLTVKNESGKVGNFTAGKGMTATDAEGKYTVSQAQEFSFTLSNVADHYTPVVKIGEGEALTATENEGTYSYTVSAGTVKADSNLNITVTEEAKYNVSVSGNANVKWSTDKSAADSEWKTWTDSEKPALFKEDKLYYKVEAKEGYRLADSDVVKIGSESQKPDSAGIYELTMGEDNVTITVATVEQKTLTFKLTGVKALTYFQNKTTGTAVSLAIPSEGDAKLTVDAGTMIWIKSITPADGYDMQGDADKGYKGVTVTKGSEVSYDTANEYWSLGATSDDSEVSIVIQKEKAEITISDDSKLIKSVKISEAVFDGDTEKSVSDNGYGEAKDVDLVDGQVKVTINKGSHLFIYGVTYADGSAHAVWNKIVVNGGKDGGYDVTGVPFEFPGDKPFRTINFNGGSTVELGTGTLESSKVIFANPETDIANKSIAEESVVKISEKTYLKRDTGLSFTLTPASEKAIKKVEYSYKYIDDKTFQEKTATGTLDRVEASSYKYTLPAEDVNKAIAAGSEIKITATVGADKVDVTFNKDTNGSTIKYHEYTVSKDSGGATVYTSAGSETPVTFEGEAKTANVKVGNGNVIAVTVTPKEATADANAYMLLSDSVKVDGTAVEALKEDVSAIGAGSYIITPVEPDDAEETVNNITVNTYAPVTVTTTEAKGKNKASEETEKTLTKTGLTEGTVTGVVAETKITTGADIEFKVDYADTLGSFYVKLLDPEAAYVVGSGDEATSTPITLVEVKDESGKLTGYKIEKSDVEAAIKAGGNITITAKATAYQIKEATVSLTSDITKATFSAYASKDDYKNGKDPVSSSDEIANGGKFEFQEGNYVVIADLRGIESSEVDFVKVTEGSGDDANTIYGKAHGTYLYELGTLTADTTVSIANAKLAAANIKVLCDPEDNEGYTALASINSQDIIDNNISYTRLVDGNDLEVGLTLDVVDSLQNYKFTPQGAKLTAGKDIRDITLKTSGGVFSCEIPFEMLAKAAFATPAELTITAPVEYAGYNKQKIEFRSYANSTQKVKVAGEIVQGSYNVYDITYGKDAEITVTPDAGYKLTEILYAPAMLVPSSGEDEWLHKRNNKYVTKVDTGDGTGSEFTIPGVDEGYYIYVTAEETEEYTLFAGTAFEAVPSGDEISESVEYNQASYPIWVKKGATAETIGDTSKWTVTATVPGETEGAEPVNVKTKVFGSIEASATELSFVGSDADVQGKKVTITIASVDKKGGDGEDKDDPKYSWTINLGVTKAITASDIKFDSIEAANLQLGQVAELPLTVGETFDIARVSLLKESVDSSNVNLIDAELDYENNKVIVSTAILGKDLIGKSVKLNIVDRLDNSKVISTCTVNIKDNAVKDITADSLNKIKTTATNDTITLDFSEIPFGSEEAGYGKDLDSLYWLVNITSTVADDAELINKVENLLIPATVSKYDVNLAKNDESYDAESHDYTVKVKLVQTKPEDGAYKAENNAAISTAEGTATAKTEANGIFATKLTFTKNKDKNYSKIYSTMGDVVLGTVNFPDISKGTPVTVKRLKKVEVTNKAGDVLFNTEDDGNIIKIGEDNATVIFNPSEVSPYFTGTYNMVAYAVEPKGVDVTVKSSFTVAQGLTELNVSAPSSVYKALGKAASVKALVSYKPARKPLPTKKVTWSITSDYAGEEPISIAGVTVKNGTISIAKDVVIPEDGLEFYVCATAADYAVHTDLKATAHVEVHSQAEAPAFITLGDTEIKNNGEYYTNELVGTLTAYDSNFEPIDATFTVSGLVAEKDQNKVIRGAYADKAVKKATIKATTADGSKLPTAFNFVVKSDTTVTPELRDNVGDDILEDGEKVGTYSATNDFAAGKYMCLYVRGERGGAIDHSIKFDGVKKVKSYNHEDGTEYILDATKNAAKVTITEKSTKEETVIDITNTKVVASKVAAYKVTASNTYDSAYKYNSKTKAYETVSKDNKGNIFNYLSYNDDAAYKKAGAFNKVTYTVMNGKSAAANTKLLISTGSYDLASEVFDKNNATMHEERDGEYTVETDAKGQFTIDYSDNGRLILTAGNYSFTVTPIDENENAIAKTTTFKFKAAPAPKAKVAVGTTAFKNFSDTAAFGPFKTMNNIVVNTEADGDVTTAAFNGEVRGVNTKGVINKFATTFATLNADGAKADGWLTCINAPATENYDKGVANNGMTGYVGYKWTNLDGTEGSALVKITVKPAKNTTFKKYVPTP